MAQAKESESESEFESNATISTEPNSELHEEFRSITMLLSQVASFDSDDSGCPKHLTHDMRSPQRGNFALNAIATILTRDVEALAVAADNKVDASSMLMKASFVVAAQPRESRSLSTQADRWRRIFSMASLDGETKGAPCTLIPPGQSHWPSVLKQEWFGLSLR
jgi:hypothetical protein